MAKLSTDSQTESPCFGGGFFVSKLKTKIKSKEKRKPAPPLTNVGYVCLDSYVDIKQPTKEIEMSENENAGYEQPAEKTAEQLRIEELERELEYANNSKTRYLESLSDLRSKVSQAEELIKEAIADDDIEYDNRVVERLSEIFDWTLTEEHRVTVTAVFTATITAPIGKGTEGLEDELEAELSLSWDRQSDGYELDVDYGTEITID